MRRRKSRGIITVFVTLIMVPVVVFTGTMVDVARLKLYSSQAAMAADSYGEVVLSEYDYLLKELYGLFSVTQNEEGKQAIENLAKYTEYSFIPNGDDNDKIQGFMPYKEAEINVSYEPVSGATLANNNVLMTQVSDFMKFRVIEELMKESNILGTMESFGGMSEDMKAVEMRTDITDSSTRALGTIEKYYNTLKKINDYPDYLEWMTGQFEDYSEALKDIYESDEYEAYVNYLDNKDEIDAAVKAVEEAEEADAEAKKEAEEAGETFDETQGQVANLSDETKAKAEEYVDVTAFKKSVEDAIGDLDSPSYSSTSYLVKFEDIDDLLGNSLSSFETNALYPLVYDGVWGLKYTLDEITEQVSDLRGQLAKCSDNMREGIEAEIKDLENIVKVADEFEATYKLFETNCNAHNDGSNKWHFDNEISKLDDVKDDILSGKQDDDDWEDTISFDWYDFQDDKAYFYTYLKELCEGNKKTDNGDVEADEDAADDEIDRADEKTNEINEKLKEDEKTDARDISDTLAKQLEKTESYAEVPDMMDCFSGSASIGDILNGTYGKFLLTTYNFGMFSSRVSGIEKPDDESDTEGGNVADGDVVPTETEGEKEEYFDESLTKVKMSKDVNYLYGAELEYLIGGYNKSKDNLNFTRNIICGVRTVANFASTYSISEVNSAINAIANAAASAVAATGVGAPAAPLVRVAVSGALRLAVAALETYADWEDLKDREDVMLYKSKLEDMTAAEEVMKFLSKGEKKSGTTKPSVSVKLSYEDYMYIMMLFFVDEDTLLNRTANLITLNVNQSQNDADKLTTLDFQMKNTVTAVKSTCEVNLKFVVVPENFVNLFIADTNAEAIIQKLDDGSYGYSVIRGY